MDFDPCGKGSGIRPTFTVFVSLAFDFAILNRLALRRIGYLNVVDYGIGHLIVLTSRDFKPSIASPFITDFG